MADATVRKASSPFAKRLKQHYVKHYGELPGLSKRFVGGAQRDDAFQKIITPLEDGNEKGDR